MKSVLLFATGVPVYVCIVGGGRGAFSVSLCGVSHLPGVLICVPVCVSIAGVGGRVLCLGGRCGPSAVV